MSSRTEPIPGRRDRDATRDESIERPPLQEVADGTVPDSCCVLVAFLSSAASLPVMKHPTHSCFNNGLTAEG
ncbi:unnamed protein product [Arctogadus glacialis]